MEFLTKMRSAQSYGAMEKMVKMAIKAGVDPRTMVPQFALGINFGKNFMLSVQASCGHYCQPRLTLSSYDEYESFEVAISKTGGKSFWSAKKVLGKDCELANVLDEKYFDGSVFARVPKDEVEKLYQAMKEKFGIADGN